MSKGVKITSAANCQHVSSALPPWLDKVPLLKRCKFKFQYDNATSHLGKAEQVFLSSLGFEDVRLID